MTEGILRTVQQYFGKNDPEALVFPKFGEHFQEDGFDDVVVLNKFHAMRCLMHVWQHVDVPDLPSFDKVLSQLYDIYDVSLPYVNLDNEEVCALHTVGDFARFADDSIRAVLRLRKLAQDTHEGSEITNNTPSSSTLFPVANVGESLATESLGSTTNIITSFWSALPTLSSLAPAAAGAAASAIASTDGTIIQRTLERWRGDRDRYPGIHIPHPGGRYNPNAEMAHEITGNTSPRTLKNRLGLGLEDMDRIDLDNNEINALFKRMCIVVGHGEAAKQFHFEEDGQLKIKNRDDTEDGVARDIARIWAQFSGRIISAKDRERGLREFSYFINMLSEEDFPLTHIYGYNHDGQNDSKLPGYGLVVTNHKILPATQLFGVFDLRQVIDKINADIPERRMLTTPSTSMLADDLMNIVKKKGNVPILAANGKNGALTEKDILDIETATHTVAAVARIAFEEGRKDSLGMAESLSMLAGAASRTNNNSPDELKNLIEKVVEQWGKPVFNELRAAQQGKASESAAETRDVERLALDIARAQKCNLWQMLNGCFETRSRYASRNIEAVDDAKFAVQLSDMDILTKPFDQQTWKQIFLRVALTDRGLSMIASGIGFVDNDIPVFDKAVLAFIDEGVTRRTLTLLADSNLSPAEFIEGLTEFEKLKAEAAKVRESGRDFDFMYLTGQLFLLGVVILMDIWASIPLVNSAYVIWEAIGFLITLLALMNSNPAALVYYAYRFWPKYLRVPWMKRAVAKNTSKFPDLLADVRLARTEETFERALAAAKKCRDELTQLVEDIRNKEKNYRVEGLEGYIQELERLLRRGWIVVANTDTQTDVPTGVRTDTQIDMPTGQLQDAVPKRRHDKGKSKAVVVTPPVPASTADSGGGAGSSQTVVVTPPVPAPTADSGGGAGSSETVGQKRPASPNSKTKAPKRTQRASSSAGQQSGPGSSATGKQKRKRESGDRDVRKSGRSSFYADSPRTKNLLGVLEYLYLSPKS